MLEDSEIIQSMSRVGRCIDNGPIEGFWGIIKAEMYYLNEFHTTEELKASIKKYIAFYNDERPQGRYCDQTPMEVRTAALTAVNEVQQYPIKVNKRIEKYYQSFKLEKTSIATA